MLAWSWSGPLHPLFFLQVGGRQSLHLLHHRCGNCLAADRNILERIVKSALWVIGCSLTDIYTSRCKSKASCIMRDVSHPAITLFAPLVYSRRLRSIWASATKQAKEYLLPWSHTTVSAHSRWLTALFIILMTKPFSLTIATIHKGNHNPSSHRFSDSFNLFIIIIWIYSICIL